MIEMFRLPSSLATKYETELGNYMSAQESRFHQAALPNTAVKRPADRTAIKLKILKSLRTDGQMTAEVLMTKTELTRSTVQICLNQLTEGKLISYHANGSAARRYFLNKT